MLALSSDIWGESTEKGWGGQVPTNNNAQIATLKETAVGTLMIKCPNTGVEISTGIMADGPTFAATPVFFSRTYCPVCRIHHDWFATEAWIGDHQLPAKDAGDTRTASVSTAVLGAWAMRVQRRRSA
jgi:hypothetical protein